MGWNIWLLLLEINRSALFQTGEKFWLEYDRIHGLFYNDPAYYIDKRGQDVDGGMDFFLWCIPCDNES